MSLISLGFFNRRSGGNDALDSDQDRDESLSGTPISDEPAESETSLAVRRLKGMLDDESDSDTDEELSATSETEVLEREQTEAPADAASIVPEETTINPQADEQIPASASVESSAPVESSEEEQAEASDPESELSKVRAGAEQAEQALAQLQLEISEKLSEARRETGIAHAAQVTEIETRAAEQLEVAVREAKASAQNELTQALAEKAQQHDEALRQVRSEAVQAQNTLARLQEDFAQLQQQMSDQVAKADAARATELAETETRAAQQLEAAVSEAKTAAQAQLSRTVAERAEQHDETVAELRSEAEHTKGKLAQLQARDVGLGGTGTAVRPMPNIQLGSPRWRPVRPNNSRRPSARPRRRPRPRLIGSSGTRPSYGGLPPEASSRWSLGSRRPRQNQIVRVTRRCRPQRNRPEHRLESEVARVRAEAERAVGKELETAHAKAEERRRRATEKAHAIAELEAAQALEDALERTMSDRRAAGSSQDPGRPRRRDAERRLRGPSSERRRRRLNFGALAF